MSKQKPKQEPDFLAALERGIEKARIAEEEEKAAEIWYDRCKAFAKEAGFIHGGFKTMKEVFMCQALIAKQEREKAELQALRTSQESWSQFS